MKNQYVADIGDYGKYSMLKHFEDAGIRIGINWYQTKDDDSNDGSFVRYLADEKNRMYDPEIFDALKKLFEKDRRSVFEVEKSKLFQNVRYYNEIMEFCGSSSERVFLREKWHKKAVQKLEDTDLVFLDPDNGLLVNGNTSKKGSEKYVLPQEVLEYYKTGHNVVFYCHKGRRTQEQWEDYKRFMHNMISYSETFGITFHKGTQRSYIFLIHPKDYEKYQSIINSVLEDWNGIFTYEEIDIRHRLKNVYNGLQKYIDEKLPRYDDLFTFLDSNGMVVHNYFDFVSSQPIDVDYELKKLETTDIEKCSALLTMLFREDHFSEGSFDRHWSKGEVQMVIRRLMMLIYQKTECK